MNIIQFIKEYPAISAASLTVCFTFVANLILKFIDKTIKEQNLRIAVKYEIFANAYEVLDIKRVANDMKQWEKKETKKVYPLRNLIYSNIRNVAYNSSISNSIISAFGKNKDELFILYAIFNEYNLVIGSIIQKIDNLKARYCSKGSFNELGSQGMEDFIKKCLPSYVEICDDLINHSIAFQKMFKNRFLKSISIIDNESWIKYQKDMKLAKAAKAKRK